MGIGFFATTDELQHFRPQCLLIGVEGRLEVAIQKMLRRVGRPVSDSVEKYFKRSNGHAQGFAGVSRMISNGKEAMLAYRLLHVAHPNQLSQHQNYTLQYRWPR